ncbi:peptidase U32 family protein [Pseudoflavonifractor phocaeensis]|uniref:peptidase U32 family protein n=1 Tax=Pseudoflavonifractor phocaeensis TaxID=1870988 RepID=UPI00210CEE97|nr:U32 family peptidase [Pseudoflavonifractor phocaeensis]MCQ4864814.1 U32 family peptidase [Pseudoflavonifractor phocaeensis]
MAEGNRVTNEPASGRHARPEVLAPAGDMERLRMAVAYGADAVYLAGNQFGMRTFAGNFSPAELEEAVKLCAARGVLVNVTCNTMPRNGEVSRLPEWLEYLDSLRVNAVIVAEVGTLALAKRYAPHLDVHISTQASIVNFQCASAWYDLGAKRVILARELSLDEIREIRARTPMDLEIECFVHGAMCVSYSGRCLLSNYMTGRDSNRGACAQPCRYRYALVEEKRPGEYFPVCEDGENTYIMNSRDMCMIDHIPELIDAGVDSFKIEGRAKSAYYAAVITQAYRRAADAALAGVPLDGVWRDEVEHVSHRHYSTGFYFGQPGQYTEDSRYIRDWQVCALVESCGADGAAVLSLRNKFAVGDELELVGPGVRPTAFTVPDMTDGGGLPILEARKPEMKLRMRLPVPVPPLSLLRRRVQAQGAAQ